MTFEDQNNKINQENNQEVNQESQEQAQGNQESKCCVELRQTKEKLQYLAAEFDNYRKRYERERANWIDQAQMSVIKDILPVIDDLERALEGQQDIAPEVKTYLQGFEIILKEMRKLLDNYNVKEIEASGELDPEEHEAMIQVESEDIESGQIVQVLQKGYKHKEKVIRPAKVSVAS